MRRAPAIRRIFALAALAGLATLAGCHRHTATAADCRAVLDRLVELELKEQGFHDPALVPRWQEELAGRFSDDLGRCRAVRVGNDLGACLRAAQNPEEIAHRCVK
ncbi:MAG TPA: hypothetical protein VLA79_13635 [Polyangia bacterium]|nr:hypothetical protein [Polyangia bacterium]